MSANNVRLYGVLHRYWSRKGNWQHSGYTDYQEVALLIKIAGETTFMVMTDICACIGISMALIGATLAD